MANAGTRAVGLPTLGWAKRKGTISFGALITTGAAGVIASQDKSEFTGMLQVVKTAAQVGRYTFQLPTTYKSFRGGNVTIIGPASANYGASTTGLDWFWRQNDIDGQNKDGTIELQFVQASFADAELPNGTAFIVEIVVETGI